MLRNIQRLANIGNKTKERLMYLYNRFYAAKLAIYIALICIVVIILSTKGITDESVVSLQGDMPKYLMNGVCVYDYFKDLTIYSNPLDYAYLYYARYPALSMGHHPILLAFAEVPFFKLFGVSIFSAKLMIIFFMLLGAVAWFILIEMIYDRTIAILSSLLFITTPFIVQFTRVVMSEIPTLSLLILTSLLLYRYITTNNKMYAWTFSLFLAFSIYSRHTAIFIVPVVFSCLVFNKGFRVLIRKEIILSSILAAFILLPIIPITHRFMHAQIRWISEVPLESKFLASNLFYYVKIIYEHHLTLPVLVLSSISIILALLKRDRKAIFFLLWILCLYFLITYLSAHRPRYAIYWIPCFCLFAVIVTNYIQYKQIKRLILISISLIIIYQFLVSFQMNPIYAYGYEEAAKYVVKNRKGNSVFFSGLNDSGYFIFFIRKHDPDRELIVLRSDKILATSMMDRIVEERINKRQQIYEILKGFGVGYVVIEDTETESRSLEWLRQEVKSENFILRKVITLRSNRHKVNNVPLAIYEYKNYTPPKEGKMLHMNIPLMGGSIKIPFKDLLKKNK